MKKIMIEFLMSLITFKLFIVVAYFVRIADKILNKHVPFSYRTAVGIENIQKTAFTGILIIVATVVSYIAGSPYMDQMPPWKQILLYFSVGWFIDSLFIKVINYGDQIIKKYISEKEN